ncbi:hypothetical protein MNL09_02800 [Bartonella krasnovii]|nr:hypothetical protein MNL09_02800 [Bartonella krasnovii]
MAHVTTELQELITGVLRAVIVTLGEKEERTSQSLFPKLKPITKEKGRKNLSLSVGVGGKNPLNRMAIS